MDAEQQAAATKIAAVKKGKVARQEAKEKKEAVSKVAAIQRGRQARKERQDQEKGAVAIQSRIRGRKARKMKPQPGVQRFFTPAEVASHNTADDIWLSFFNKVIDITPLIKENPGHLVQPLIAAAGTDISHWFDPVTKDVRMYIDSATELEVPFTPMGLFLHCPPKEPSASWSSDIGTVWWRDRTLAKGMLTQRTRMIQLENMLTKQKIKLEVCEEETLQEIQNRYARFNSHSGSYTWKRTDSESVARLLDMKQTLDDNGIKDDAMEFERLNIDPDFYIPTIQLYFADDLTIA